MPSRFTTTNVCQLRYTVTSAALNAASGYLQLDTTAFPPGRVIGVHVVKKTPFNAGSVWFTTGADASEKVASAAEVAATTGSPDAVECAAWKTDMNAVVRAAATFLYGRHSGAAHSSGEMDLIISYVPAPPEY